MQSSEDTKTNESASDGLRTPNQNDVKDIEAEGFEDPAKVATASRTIPDISELRLSQDFASEAGLDKVTTQVPVRRPDKQTFFRVRPGEDFHIDTAVVVLEEDRETYLVAPELRSYLTTHIVPKRLALGINRQNGVFLWPITLPDPNKPTNSWVQSALDAVPYAEQGWISLRSNMQMNMYEVFRATGDLDDPVWPSESFNDLLDLAFKGRFIDSPDHVVVRKLQGQI